MGNGSERPDAGGWSDLEQHFFASAPPDVAVQPPAPPTFDDLEPPARLSRATRPRAARSRKTGVMRASRGSTAPPAPARERAAGAQAFFRRVAEKAINDARPAAANAWRGALARTAVGRRQLALALRAMRDASARGLRAVLERVLVDLPAERPDGKSILAAVAALIVVCGLSARVLGSHAQWTALRAPVAIVAPAPVAPTPAPAPEAVLPAPADTIVATKTEQTKAAGLSKRHVSRRHPHHVAAARVRGPIFIR